MTQRRQEQVFEQELHALCVRFFDEWDLQPESMLEMLESEKMFIISVMQEQDNSYKWEDGEPTGEWGINGSDDE